MDKVTKETRSKIMSRIRSKGNKSTEARVRAALAVSGVRGWVMHPKSVTGRPDFFFPKKRLAVFIDGCFWHGCPKCYRRPSSRQEYWDKKLERNMARDRIVNQELQSDGITVMRVWEHDVTHYLSGIIEHIRKELHSKPKVNKP